MNRINLLLLVIFLLFNNFLPVFSISENICNNDSDCLNFGQCQLLPDSIIGKLKKQCKCATDFTGVKCEIQKCPENPCVNDGICELTNSASKFKCHCPLGYNGSLCETKLSNACDNFGCVHGHCRLDGSVDKGLCDCFYGFEGEKCDTKTMCDPASCSGHGICSSSSNNGTSVTCTCDSGWNGDRCQVDIDECENDATLCNNHGECINSPGSYFCRCSAGFHGVHCDKADTEGCSSKPCQNGGICSASKRNGRDFSCTCLPGFKGDLCEENINECARYDDPNLGDSGKNLSKCTNGGSCIDGINEFNCVCPNGFTGKDCRQNIDECSLFGVSLCQNGGSCIDTYGSYQCACVYGFEGKHCETNVNDCENNLCYEGSKCIDRIRSYECECQEDRIGIYCQFENPCYGSKNKCQNGQCFADITNGNFSCFCDKGFTGEHCNIDINECENSPCYKGKCINENGGYKCECEKGYDGPNCDILIDECEDRPCLNGGTCIDLAGDFKCICMPSWNGKNCEIPKPYSPACDKTMCMHGGVCRKTPFGEEYCQCSARFSGKSCEMIKPNPCDRNKCSSANSLKCHPTNDYNSYTCECKNGYGGEFCEQKIQSCSDNPCLVGECFDTSIGFKCRCPPGFKGINCEININECKPNICGTGICLDGINGYSCKCPATHTGKHCEVPVTDPCQNEPCLNNGTCMTYNIHGNFICKCPSGFTGANCEIRTDICDSTKCQNGGYCNSHQQTCQCPEGFSGIFCEKNQNKCLNIVCQNGGTCENLDNDFVCKCPYVWPFGYAGRYCQEKVNIEKYKPEETKEKEECQKNECEKLAGNGRCDKQCNFPGCNYDGGDCSASNPDPFGNCSYASFCKYVFRDNHCDEICNNEGCLFDGFDCQEKTATKCPLEKQCLEEYGNGKCNPECNSAECGWDGGDCISEKKELSESLVLTLITDPKDFLANNIASKLLITLSQLLHVSVHYQLDSNGNPMIYEWSSSAGQGSLLQMTDNSHSITKRSVDVKKKGVKVYLILDVSVCQQLSSLGGILQLEVINENQKCFTATQSAADMLAADSTKEAFGDLNIGVADATVMPRSPPQSSNLIIYIIFGIIGTIILVAVLINVASLRPVKRKFVTVRNVFVPPTSDELKNREKLAQLYPAPYGNQLDRESLMAANLTGSTLLMPTADDTLGEPVNKRFREDEPQKVFTKLHEIAASDMPITDEQLRELSMCATVKDPTNGQTCIHWAVESRIEKSDSHVIEDIKKLVSIGCPVDAQDDSGATALHLAVRNGRTEVATYLLSQIDVNAQDDDGRTALFDAVSTKSLEMVQRILSVANVDVHVIAYTNDTPLIQCCRMADNNNEMLAIAKELLRHPSIQIDKVGNKSELKYSGRTAIHEAAACNSIQILKLLINRGAVITVHDVHEQTPLFLAVQSNQIEAVKLLIHQMRTNKVEINASNDCGETPLQIALSKGYTEIAELLQNAGAQMPIPARFQVLPSAEHLKFPEMKAIALTAVKASPPKQNTTKKPAGNKKRKGDNNVNGQPSQKQVPNNPMAQQQVMGFYPLNNPMLQMPQYSQIDPSMLQYPNNYHQIAQPQSHHYQQQQQFHPDYYQPQQQLSQMNPSSNYSSNPPSAHLPQCSSTSPHVSSDSAYGSPNSYQNSLTNTSGQSDGFASPPSSYDTGFWPNPSPDTAISNTSNTVTPMLQQSNYSQASTKHDLYFDKSYPVASNAQQQYPQQHNWDSSFYHPQNLANYSSSTTLQHYPTYSQPQNYYQNYQRPPHIPYPQANQSMPMNRSASFAALPSQCATDFTGVKCEIQKCPENPCVNDGICELTNSASKFKCHCPLGYNGSLCETKLSNACDNFGCVHGHCRLDGSVDKGLCDCFYGFEGEKCDTKTMCDPASCSGHGICSSSSNNGTSVTCTCDSGWNGDRCQVDIDECENDATLCNNHGECINSPGSYFCRCSAGFHGVHCDKADTEGCSSKPCQNGGICSASKRNGRDFSCTCLPGFKGDLCEENINECARYDDPNLGDSGKNLSKCTNGGSCIDGINEFNCVCPNGFTGKDCRQNIDECSLFGVSLCQNGGSCIDTYGSYQCACVYGFEGKHCETNVNDCENNLCYEGSKCIDRIRSYECECQEDRIGIYCQFENPCYGSKNKCQNGQCFADITNGNFSCFCDKGFTGEHCNIDINECENSPCYKGKCINENGGYKCECEKGYDGPNCDILIDECEDRPCLNGGTCIDLAGDFKCICMPSWNGKNCEIPKPYSPACDKTMCMHGGVCRKTPFGEEYCQCSARFSGKSCEMIKPNPCDRNKCSSANSLKCHPTNDYNSYTCECKNGYGGEFCEQKIQSCSDNPCLVGECFDTSIGFKCRCPPGFKGINCEININECKPNICGTGICLDGINGYSCKCPATHTGKHCEVPVTDPCQNEPCLNNGTCMTYNIHGNFICKCPSGFTGANCEIRTDICDSTKCQNGGYCNSHQQTCQCPEGFSGIFCEKNQNKCLNIVCQNGGTCENLDNDFVCKCPYVWPFGYAGRYCQEKVNIEKYKPEETKEKEECQKNECEKLAGNGRCDKQCNFPGCNYDGGDCSASNPDPFGNCSYASFCKYVFRDNHCDEICNNEGCLFDGFDCQEKTATKCPLEKQCLEEYGNGKCNPECNSAECGWDGGDCISEKKELSESLVLTLITDPKDFLANNIASKLLITLSQLLHVSVHYQLDSNGNPMIYEWSSSAGQGSLLQMTDNSHSITKRSVDVKKKGVKVYLILDVSVCQQLSSLGGILQLEVINENQKCFTATQSAADMLAADSTKEAFGDLNIGVADATVMPRSPPQSSNLIIYIIFGIIGTIILVAVLINVASLRPVKRKFVTVRNVFVPPTSDELKNREKLAQLYPAPYGNQLDRESLMAANLTGSTLLMPTADDTLGEPVNKRFREDEPQKVFTKLHEIAASDMPITDEQLRELSMCATVKDPTNGQTCIHWAVESRIEKSDSHVIEDIKKLVSIGCPVDAQDDSGATALHLAVRNGRTEVATYLLSQIDVNAQDDDGRTALFDAVSTKSLEMVQRILSVANVDVHVIAYTNDTPLIQCCRMADNNNEMLAIAKELLRHPSIQIDKVGNKSELKYSGRTAIHEAAACNSIQILKLLINRGAVITVHDVHEQTPLFLAVQSNQIEAVKLLIHQMRTNKVEINASNDCGETPLQIALSKGYTEIAELLQNAGAQMPIPARFQVLPSAEHLKFPEMKAIALTAVKASPPKQNTTKKPAGNKKRKGDNNVNGQPSQKQVPNNPMAQQQVMGFYPLNNPMLQMPQYSQIDPSMLQYPNNYHQIAQPQSHHYQQQQQFHPDYYQPQQQLSQMNPSSNYSSNPPSAHLPQCSSTSPHVSSDSAYGSPNSYQNSLTNTSGQSDGFASPPSSYDTGFWPNPSPDTAISNTSNTVTPMLQQSNYSQASTKHDLYFDKSYPVASNAQQQYPQQHNWDSSFYHPQNLANYSSSTTLQHYPTYSQPQNYYQNYQRPPHIPYPQANQSMPMNRSASFAALPSQ